MLSRRGGGGGRGSTTYQLVEPPLTAVSALTAVSGVGCHQRQGTPDSSVTLSRLIEQDSFNNNSTVVDVLVDLEISDPTRSRLAALDGITVELVKRVAKRTESQGGGTGAIVRNIETAVAAKVKRQAKAKAKVKVEADLAVQEHQRREAEQAQAMTGEDRKKLIHETLDRLR